MDPTVKKILRKSGFYFGLLLFTVFAVFPEVWMVITAFKEEGDLYDVSNNPII
jgi:multiple sugar transport system permease protein